ncbi:MAG: OmpA family protein [Treponema sp.]|jgi:outer membrane protein OmpA-like peptidoglycan-associated protein|nr:OmpA family protein [Treponema sp.]
MIKFKKIIILLLVFIVLINGLYAQTEFPAGNFWSLDAGLGISGLFVKGMSYQLILDPKLWLSPLLMVGSRLGVSYSTESDSRNILTFEGQVYLRWNFLRLGSTEKNINIFFQAGIGLISAYRGTESPFDNVTMTRGSLLFDAAAGITIPLTPRWHIEASIRGGYPHIAGFSITAGYKFPLPEKTRYQDTSAVAINTETVRMLPPVEIIKRTMISAVEFILFGPDIGEYNVGIDHDAQGLNELALNSTARLLMENPDFLVRVEGHANPVTTDPREADELMALGSKRAHAVADQLRARGVSEEQMVIISYGGTRTVTSDHDIWNRNRRVELIVIQVDTN